MNVLKRLQATIPGCAEPDWCHDGDDDDADADDDDDDDGVSK